MNQQTRYNKAYVIVAAIAMVVLGFFGYQWYQKYYFKNLLQQEFDSQYQRWGRGSFCYELGKVNFPYIDRGYPAEFTQQSQQLSDGLAKPYQFPNYRIYRNQYQLNRLLPIYYEAGLLSRQLVQDGGDYFQYDLTELGKKYQAQYDGKLVFCYGYQKVQEVTDITKNDASLYPGKKYIYVTYNFEIDDFPNWAENIRFDQAYSAVQGKVHIGSKETFIEGSEGIFIDGNFNSHIYSPRLADSSW